MLGEIADAFKRFCSIGLMLGLITEAAFAQNNLDDWKNVMDMAPDSGISVKTKAGKKFHGDLVSVGEKSLTIYSNEAGFPGRIKRLREISQTDVREVRTLTPTASVLVGSAIGGGIGAGLGAIADASARTNEDRGVATATLGLLGAAIGGAIGRSNPIVKGKKIYVAH